MNIQQLSAEAVPGSLESKIETLMDGLVAEAVNQSAHADDGSVLFRAIHRFDPDRACDNSSGSMNIVSLKKRIELNQLWAGKKRVAGLDPDQRGVAIGRVVTHQRNELAVRMQCLFPATQRYCGFS
jgi:hypothetical protein